MCTDVAARGLDIPFVGNVVHYQCPFNAEIYVHRCGRTARIGREGDSLNLLSPDDNKNFKGICQVLKKSEDSIAMYSIKYAVLEKLKPLISQAKDLEKTVHQKKQKEKSANWMMTQAKDAELELDEELQYEIQEQLGGKKKLASSEMLKDSRLAEFTYDKTIHRKRENK